MTKRKHAGRPPILLRCKLCKGRFNKTELRLHEPDCRREHLLKIGMRFTVMLNGRLVRVAIESFVKNSSAIDCRNLETGRRIRVRSPRRFREWMDKAGIRYRRPAA